MTPTYATARARETRDRIIAVYQRRPCSVADVVARTDMSYGCVYGHTITLLDSGVLELVNGGSVHRRDVRRVYRVVGSVEDAPAARGYSFERLMQCYRAPVSVA